MTELTEKQLKNKAEIKEWFEENQEEITVEDLQKCVNHYNIIKREVINNYTTDIDRLSDLLEALEDVTNVEHFPNSLTVETDLIGVIVDVNDETVMHEFFNIYIDPDNFIDFEDCNIVALESLVKDLTNS